MRMNFLRVKVRGTTHSLFLIFRYSTATAGGCCVVFLNISKCEDSGDTICGSKMTKAQTEEQLSIDEMEDDYIDYKHGTSNAEENEDPGNDDFSVPADYSVMG